MSTHKETPLPASRWFARWAQAPVTGFLSIVCVVAFLVPGLSSLLECDVAQIVAGQYWRIATGHLTHFSSDHLVWDLGVFVCLGYLCESRNRWLTYITLALSALLISALAVLLPSLDSYRGLSGLDTGLFALLSTQMLLQNWRQRDWPAVMMFSALMALMISKVIWESITGDCLFVDAATSAFTPVPFAHLVGALVGIGCGWAGQFLNALWLRQLRVGRKRPQKTTPASVLVENDPWVKTTPG